MRKRGRDLSFLQILVSDGQHDFQIYIYKSKNTGKIKCSRHCPNDFGMIRAYLYSKKYEEITVEDIGRNWSKVSPDVRSFLFDAFVYLSNRIKEEEW